MDLPPDKAKLLKNYDDDRKWEIICDRVSGRSQRVACQFLVISSLSFHPLKSIDRWIVSVEDGGVSLSGLRRICCLKEHLIISGYHWNSWDRFCRKTEFIMINTFLIEGRSRESTLLGLGKYLLIIVCLQ